jgi:hypothetical protein
MEVESNESAVLLKLLKTRSRTRTELLKSAALNGVPAERLWTPYWPKEKS